MTSLMLVTSTWITICVSSSMSWFRNSSIHLNRSLARPDSAIDIYVKAVHNPRPKKSKLHLFIEMNICSSRQGQLAGSHTW